MPVRTLPLDYDLTIYSGTTFRRDFRWSPDGNAPVDFTGWSGSMLIGPYHSAAIKTLDTAANGGMALSALGVISITLSPVFTLTLSPADTPLNYQLDLTDPGGFAIRFMRGRITVVRDVNAAGP
jgi:hypothetical protein